MIAGYLEKAPSRMAEMPPTPENSAKVYSKAGQRVTSAAGGLTLLTFSACPYNGSRKVKRRVSQGLAFLLLWRVVARRGSDHHATMRRPGARRIARNSDERAPKDVPAGATWV